VTALVAIEQSLPAAMLGDVVKIELDLQLLEPTPT